MCKMLGGMSSLGVLVKRLTLQVEFIAREDNTWEMIIYIRVIMNEQMKDAIITSRGSDVYKNEDNSVISILGLDIIDTNHITFSE